MTPDRDDEPRLTAFALGELDDDAERAAVEELLAGSPEARRLVDEVRAAEIALRDSLADEPFSSDGRDLRLSPAQRQAIEDCLAPRRSGPLTLATAPGRAGFHRSRLARLALAASLLVGVGTAILTYQNVPTGRGGGMAPGANFQVGRAMLPKSEEASESIVGPKVVVVERGAIGNNREDAGKPTSVEGLQAAGENKPTQDGPSHSFGAEAGDARKMGIALADAVGNDKPPHLNGGMMGAAMPPAGPTAATPAPALGLAAPETRPMSPARSELDSMAVTPGRTAGRAPLAMRPAPASPAPAPASAPPPAPARVAAVAEKDVRLQRQSEGRGLVFRNIEPDAKPGERSGKPVVMALKKEQREGKDQAPVDRFQATREQLAQTITPASRAAGAVSELRQKLVVENRLPERGRVEVAALINDLALPAIALDEGLIKQKALQEQPVTLDAEIASSPWATSNRLARIAVQARPGAPGQVVARNARLRVEFEPRVVAAFRPVGSDAFDHGGDQPDPQPVSTFNLVAGESLTALYEMVPVMPSPKPPPPSLLVRLAYEAVGPDAPRSIQLDVRDEGLSIDRASDAFRLAAAVAAFGRRLDDPAIQAPSFDFILDLARGGLDRSRPLPPGQRTVIELIERARDIERDEPPAAPGPVP